MNFQKLNINSNNFFKEKHEDFQEQNQIPNNKDKNLDSLNSIKAQCSEIQNATSFNPQIYLDYNTKDFYNQIECTKCSPISENFDDNQIIDYGKRLNNLISISNNFLVKQKHKRKKETNTQSNGKHTKYSHDNLQRRCKSLVLNYTLEYLNYQIKKIYKGNIGNGIYVKKLFDISQEQKVKNSSFHIKNIMNMTTGEIFSNIISKRYTSFLPNHNEIIIQRALEEEDEDKREKFKKLFNLTFGDCIKKFLGKDNSEESEGFPIFDDIKYKLNEDDEYLAILKRYLFDFGENIKSKKKSASNKIKIVN